MEEQLLQAIQQMTRRMDEMVELLKKEKSQWMTADEACEELGIRTTRSGTHKRRLKWLREKGFLTVHGQISPYTYDKEQVRTIAQKIRAGSLYIPSTA